MRQILPWPCHTARETDLHCRQRISVFPSLDMVVVSTGENHLEEDPAEETITLSWLKNGHPLRDQVDSQKNPRGLFILSDGPLNGCVFG